MKASFVGRDLFSGFNLVAGIIPKVDICIANGVAYFTATHQDVAVKYKIDSTGCDGGGSITLPATKTKNMLGELPLCEEISLEIEGGDCFARSRGGYFKPLGLKAKTWMVLLNWQAA